MSRLRSIGVSFPCQRKWKLSMIGWEHVESLNHVNIESKIQNSNSYAPISIHLNPEMLNNDTV